MLTAAQLEALGWPGARVLSFEPLTDPLYVIGADGGRVSVGEHYSDPPGLYVRSAIGMMGSTPRAPATSLVVPTSGFLGGGEHIPLDGCSFVCVCISSVFGTVYWYYSVGDNGAGDTGIYMRYAGNAYSKAYVDGTSESVSTPGYDYGAQFIGVGYDARVGGRPWAGSRAGASHGNAVGGPLANSTAVRTLWPYSGSGIARLSWMAVFVGADAEYVIDHWESFVSDIWRHGQVDGLSVDADCVVAHPAPGGAGYAYWGPDQVRLTDAGLVVAPALTNYLCPSIPNDTDWTLTGSTITDFAADGLGGLRSAAQVTEDTSTGRHEIECDAAVAEGANRAIAVVQAGGRGVGDHLELAVELAASEDPIATVDLSGATPSVSHSAADDATVEDLGDGWVLVTLDYTAAAGDAGDCPHVVRMLSTGGDRDYEGDGSAHCYVAHVQAQQTTRRGPLIPTSSSTASSVATIYESDTDDGLDQAARELLSDGVAVVRERFILPELPGGDVALWSAYEDATTYLDALLEHVSGTSYRLKVTDGTAAGTSSDATLEAGVEYEARVRVYPSGAYRLELLDPHRDASGDADPVGAELADGSGTLASYSAPDVANLYRGCLHDETGQATHTITLFEVTK